MDRCVFDTSYSWRKALISCTPLSCLGFQPLPKIMSINGHWPRLQPGSLHMWPWLGVPQKTRLCFRHASWRPQRGILLLVKQNKNFGSSLSHVTSWNFYLKLFHIHKNKSKNFTMAYFSFYIGEENARHTNQKNKKIKNYLPEDSLLSTRSPKMLTLPEEHLVPFQTQGLGGGSGYSLQPLVLRDSETNRIPEFMK